MLSEALQFESTWILGLYKYSSRRLTLQTIVQALTSRGGQLFCLKDSTSYENHVANNAVHLILLKKAPEAFDASVAA